MQHADYTACYFYALPYGEKLGRLVGMPKMPTPLVDGYTPKTTECGEKGTKMILKTETLKEKGLTQEQIDFVMAEVGKEINSLTAERDTYKSQLDTANTTLESLKGVDVAGLQSTINDLKTQLGNKDGEIEKIKADYAFDTLLKGAIRSASGRNEKAIMALLDVDTLKASKNQEADIKAAIENLKKDDAYLFQNTNVPRVVSSTHGINPDVQTKKEQANEALRALYGKGE